MKGAFSVWVMVVAFAAFGQSWQLEATLELVPPTMGQGADGRYRLALSGDRLAVGDPSGGIGSVRVFSRNAGGVRAWETTAHLMHPMLTWGSFGKALAMRDEDLVAGGFWGAWHYRFSGDLIASQRQILDGSAWNIAFDGERAVICGPLVPAYPTGLLTWFEYDASGELQETGGLALPPHSGYLTTCMGAVLAQASHYLIVSDSCWSTTDVSQQTGLIRTFRWDEAANTYLIDAPEDAYGGYWPFGEGVEIGPHFGRTQALSGDVLFVGHGPITPDDEPRVEVFIKSTLGWVPHGQLWPSPSTPVGSFIDMGLALASQEDELFVGTGRGFAVYAGEGTNLVFQEFHDLNGAVSAIAVDDDLLAVAVPALGQVHIYGRIGTAMHEAPSSGSSILSCTPNPASDHVTVNRIGQGSTIATLVLADAMGRAIRTVPWNGLGPLDMDVRDIPDQMLMLRAEDRSGRLVEAARLVVGLN